MPLILFFVYHPSIHGLGVSVNKKEDTVHYLLGMYTPSFTDTLWACRVIFSHQGGGGCVERYLEYWIIIEYL